MWLLGAATCHPTEIKGVHFSKPCPATLSAPVLCLRAGAKEGEMSHCWVSSTAVLRTGGQEGMKELILLRFLPRTAKCLLSFFTLLLFPHSVQPASTGNWVGGRANPQAVVCISAPKSGDKRLYHLMSPRRVGLGHQHRGKNELGESVGVKLRAGERI